MTSVALTSTKSEAGAKTDGAAGPRLDEAVEAMARFLAKALVLKSPEVTKVTPAGKIVESTLVEVMHDEANYWPTRERIETLEVIHDAQKYAEKVGCLAAGVLACAEGQIEFDLRALTNEIGYSCGRTFYLGQALHRAREEQLHIGGMREALLCGVASKAADWLEKCDKVLCMGRGQPWDKDDAVEAVVCKIAHAIANSQVPCAKSRDGMKDKLSPTFLGGLIDKVFTDSAPTTDRVVQRDVDALEMLGSLAANLLKPDNSGDDDARAILGNHVKCARLAQTLAEPQPAELGDVSKMKLNLLRRAVLSNSPVDARLALAHDWALRYGYCAQVATQGALRALSATHRPALEGEKRPTVFVDVVKRREPTDTAVFHMPSANAFSPAVGVWTAVQPRAAAHDRLGRLRACDRRAVRLACMVWSILACDERAFNENVVSADLLTEIAREQLHDAIYLYQQTELERKSLEMGVRWLLFNEQLHDRSSDLASKVDAMMCELSNLSACDILQAFDASGQYAKLFDASGRYAKLTHAPLARRTRELLGNAGSSPLAISGYERFAHDALTLVFVRLILARRQGLVDVGFYKTPHPLGDLVRSIYEVHSWCPSDGPFRVTLPMLKKAHPVLRDALEELAARPDGGFVRRRGSAKAAVEYVFDTPTLVHLLRA